MRPEQPVGYIIRFLPNTNCAEWSDEQIPLNEIPLNGWFFPTEAEAKECIEAEVKFAIEHDSWKPFQYRNSYTIIPVYRWAH